MLVFTVVESTCELCSEVNTHLTIDCPHITCDRPWYFATFAEFLAAINAQLETFVWLAGQLAR